MGILGSLTERQRLALAQADSVAQLQCRAKGGGSWSLICPLFRAILCQDNPRHICILWIFMVFLDNDQIQFSIFIISMIILSTQGFGHAEKTLLEQILFSSFHLEHITASGSYRDCGWMDRTRFGARVLIRGLQGKRGLSDRWQNMAGFGTLVLW